jgi:hypothetical protein
VADPTKEPAPHPKETGALDELARYAQAMKSGKAVHTFSRDWGNTIAWTSYERGTVYGLKQRRPELGDLIVAKMKSGRVGVFQFVEVTHPGDPPDMFFGKVEGLGYRDELEAGLKE